MKLEHVVIAIAGLVIGGAFSWAVVTTLNTPTVLVDVNTKECVAVLMADGTKGSCSQMPEKYDRQWVLLPVGGAK